MANIFKYITCPECKKKSTVTTESKKAPKCPECGSNMKYARKWSYRFMFEYEPHKKTGSESKRETERMMEDHRKELESGLVSDKKIKRYTFVELVEKYMDTYKHQKGYEKNKKYMVAVLERRYKNKYLDTFNTLDADELMSYYLATSANRTANGYVVLLGHMIKKAVSWEMATDTVLKKVKDIKKMKVNSRLRYLASDEERTALLNACSDQIRPIVKLALNTGMRQGEIFNLQWKNIDFDKNIILIHTGEQKNDEFSTIPINLVVKSLLKSLPRRLDCRYVFPTPDGHKRKDLRGAFRGACSRAKILDFHFHDLRHDFASNLIQKGVHLKVLQELMRHKTIEMTLKYAHLAPTDRADAVALLDQVAI